MSGINKTLEERGKRYGSFHSFSMISQDLKKLVDYYISRQQCTLSDQHKEALDMILHKISRIINGDPNYKDNWHDISGYAKLAEDECIETVKDNSSPKDG